MALAMVLSLAAAAITIYHALSRYHGLRQHLAEARKSGFPYVVHPFYVHTFAWLATYWLWIPVIRKLLPKSWQGVWVDVLDPEWAHRFGHKPFADLGSDVFLTVSPRQIGVYVANAEVITQITTRRNDFPKPLDLYKSLDLYGKSLLSTEGSDWRVHRKLTASSFGEKNNELIWNESVHHAQELVKLWLGPGGNGDVTVKDPAHDAMRFALYTISRAGFDVRVVWPHEEQSSSIPEAGDGRALLTGSTPPPGHSMNYREALSGLLENIMWTAVAPLGWLKKSPFKLHRETACAAEEWGQYMKDIYEAKAREVASGKEKDPKAGMDLFQSIIRNSGILDGDKKMDLQKSDLFGNAFVLMVAGHETTANALHFSLLYLALDVASQRRLQQDLDKVLSGKPVEEWHYEELFPLLFDGMAAAVMNETLRLAQPVINIPKSTLPGRPQQVTMDGEQYTIPGSAGIALCSAVHRNPRYWQSPTDKAPNPSGTAATNTRSDAECFRPERWLVTAQQQEKFSDIGYDDETLRGPSGEDTSAHLFKPVKGSYIPFSDGYRSCIGRRFAQVELLAVFAVIFSRYSVELAVNDWASDAEVEAMPPGSEERKALWQKSADHAEHLLKTKMSSVLTLQLRDAAIPIRLVKRGEERFFFE